MLLSVTQMALGDSITTLNILVQGPQQPTYFYFLPVIKLLHIFVDSVTPHDKAKNIVAPLKLKESERVQNHFITQNFFYMVYKLQNRQST